MYECTSEQLLGCSNYFLNDFGLVFFHFNCSDCHISQCFENYQSPFSISARNELRRKASLLRGKRSNHRIKHQTINDQPHNSVSKDFVLLDYPHTLNYNYSNGMTSVYLVYDTKMVSTSAIERL